MPGEATTVEDLVTAAESSLSPQRETLYLQAAGLAIDNADYETAETLLKQLNAQTLATPLKGSHIQLTATVALAFNRPNAAIQLLNSNQQGLIEIFADLPPSQQITLKLLKADAFELAGHYLASARERHILHDSLGDPMLKQTNIEAIWRSLNQLPTEFLDVLKTTLPDPELRAWVELALANRSYGQSLPNQLAQVDAWRQQWPTHIAAQQPPAALKLLSDAVATQKIDTLAILLPESGVYATAAKAIRDGIFMAYYDQLGQSEQPKLILKDTESQFDVTLLYQQAISEGADLVIGPLNKEKVAQLSELPELPVPVLALNYLPPPKETLESAGFNEPLFPSAASFQLQLEKEKQPPLFQFGLSAEDEARQISRRCQSKGYQVAGIIFPDSDWGHRTSQAFIESWTHLGGFVADQRAYAEGQDYSQMMRRFMAVDKSQARAKTFQQTIGLDVEFTPRRRQDLDFIVLLGKPDKARLLKPLINYYYAQDVPVYSTSTLYTGLADPQNNQDLNQIIFTDLPWVLTDTDYLKTQAVTNGLNASRLLALGIDSYRLHPRLQLFASQQGSYFSGATGLLTLDDSLRISRISSWARFSNGLASIDTQNE